MARTENQDFFGYWESDDEREFDVKGRLVVVCDGMGGHAGGEIASRLSVQTIIDEYRKDTSGNVEDALRKAIESANAAIQKEGVREPKLQGMGSTCTALVHRRDMVYFGQVGDSRGYLIRNGKIKQMTKDHSLVQELVDQGLIDKSEMEAHPDKNVILRSLGVKPQVDVDVSYVPTVPNDIFLLCSDGLSGPVSDQEMLSIVQASNGDMKAATERLIELANRYGGFDNITVQLVKVVRTDTATTDKTDKGTLTGSFSPDQVQASIEKARAEAIAKGKKVPDTKAATPAAKDPASSRSASSAPSKGGGGGLGMLVVGLILGLALGAGGAFVGLTKLKKPGGSANLADAVDSAQKALDAAQTDMGRSQAEKLAPDAFKEANDRVGAVPAAGEPAERLAALSIASSACAHAATAARAAQRELQAKEAGDRAAEAEKKAKKDSPAYARASDEFKLGKQATSDNDLTEARAHFIAAAALFEAAGQ
jgi:protein phosphatase